MAEVVVTIKRFSTDWDTLYPRTHSTQITDASDVGKNLLTKTNPSENVFLRIAATTGEVQERTAVQLRSEDLDAASTVHTHTTDQISDQGVTLTTLLAGKADLSGGYIVSSQIPDYLLGGIKYHETITGGSLNLDSKTAALPGGGTAATDVGLYLIMASDTTVTFATTSIAAPGDEGETTSGLILEAGDWLIYGGSNVWNVVNNTYRVATTAQTGVIKLADGSVTSRVNLSSTSSGLKVIDEKALRSVLKDIHYGGAPSGLLGDLWFDGTFA